MTAQDLIDTLGKNWTVIAGLVTAFSAATAGLFAFYKNIQEYLFFKRMDRLDRLGDSMQGDSQYVRAIEIKKKSEASKLIFGMPSLRAPRLKKEILNIYLTEKYDSHQIEVSAQYMDCSASGEIKISGVIRRSILKWVVRLVFFFVTILFAWILVSSFNVPFTAQDGTVLLFSIIGYLIMIVGLAAVYGKNKIVEDFESSLKDFYLFETVHSEALSINNRIDELASKE